MAETINQISRLLAGGGGETAHGEEEEHFGVHIAYTDIYAALVFLAAIYGAGLVVSRVLGMPSLVGEIFVGILMGPNLLDLVPNEEAFVMLGEIGLILLVLEAGIDIDLTTLRLIGARGLMIALIGTFLPIMLALLIVNALGYRGTAAIAAGCAFAPTSLGIAMNVLRRTGIVNTPVGQLIVAAAIIDDMIALVILSQLQAFTNEDATTLDMILPIISAIGFLVVGGALAVFVIPKILNRYILDLIGKPGEAKRDWTSLAIMLSFLLALVPLTYYSKASPLMGAFIAGLIFCSDHGAHHMFVHQFKRVMQWLLRIFFAASIGFQVPIQKFANVSVLLQGLALILALSGKVAVGFMVPNFWATKRFKMTHLRDCLVVGFSMAAEGEFAFVIAVFCVSNKLIPEELYAAIVLAVLASTILAPFCLETSISFFNKKAENTVLGGAAGQEDPAAALEKGIREKTTVFFTIQTKSAPKWGLQTAIVEEFQKLDLDVIDHRSWHPRQTADMDMNILVNEAYVKDDNLSAANFANNEDAEQRINGRVVEITHAISKAIGQDKAIVIVRRWFPEIAEDDASETGSISEHILNATSQAIRSSMIEHGHGQIPTEDRPAPAPRSDRTLNARMGGSGRMGSNSRMDGSGYDDEAFNRSGQLIHRMKQIKHLDAMFKGRLEGLFRQDTVAKMSTLANGTFDDGVEVELLDTHGVGTGRREQREKHDAHGMDLDL